LAIHAVAQLPAKLGYKSRIGIVAVAASAAGATNGITLQSISAAISGIFLTSMIPPGRCQCIGFFVDRGVNIESYRLLMQREDTTKMTTKKSAAVKITASSTCRTDSFLAGGRPARFPRADFSR
jgi:hypothetical protein